MKRITILLLISFPLLMFGQKEVCCSSKKQVEQYLTGIWHKKGSKSKTVYEFSFEKDRGDFTEMERTEKKGKYLVIDEHPHISVFMDTKGITLKFTSLYNSWVSKFTYVDTRTMVLTTDGEKVIYQREL